MHVEAASQPWVLFVMNCSPYILIESSTAEVEVGETFYTQSESPDKNTWDSIFKKHLLVSVILFSNKFFLNI